MRFLLFFAFIGCFMNTYAIHENKISAGKAAAMGNTRVTTQSIWSVYYNQAGLAYLKNIEIGGLHQTGYVKEQNLQGIVFALPTKTGTLGASYSYYGYSQYSETQAGLAFARSFTKYFSVGLQLNYLHTHIAGNYKDIRSVNFEIGLLSEPIDHFFIGAHIYNPSHSKTGKEQIPTIIDFGLSYLFSGKILLAVGVEKDFNYKPVFKLGIDYKVISFISLQAGISTNPDRYSFGIGFNYKNINANIACFKHQTLGFTPSFTLSYAF